MGVKPPQEKFNISDAINGIAMQSLAAGRAECTITRTPEPIVYVDFHAQFPAVSKLLDCREILCADSLEFADFTAEAREIVKRVTPNDCFHPAFWKRLRWFALVEPCEDVLPIRAKFAQREDSDPKLAWNFVTSKRLPISSKAVLILAIINNAAQALAIEVLTLLSPPAEDLFVTAQR
jgi:hypothetical protein